jgi:hypothetical protein
MYDAKSSSLDVWRLELDVAGERRRELAPARIGLGPRTREAVEAEVTTEVGMAELAPVGPAPAGVVETGKSIVAAGAVVAKVAELEEMMLPSPTADAGDLVLAPDPRTASASDSVGVASPAKAGADGSVIAPRPSPGVTVVAAGPGASGSGVAAGPAAGIVGGVFVTGRGLGLVTFVVDAAFSSGGDGPTSMVAVVGTRVGAIAAGVATAASVGVAFLRAIAFTVGIGAVLISAASAEVEPASPVGGVGTIVEASSTGVATSPGVAIASGVPATAFFFRLGFGFSSAAAAEEGPASPVGGGGTIVKASSAGVALSPGVAMASGIPATAFFFPVAFDFDVVAAGFDVFVLGFDVVAFGFGVVAAVAFVVRLPFPLSRGAGASSCSSVLASSSSSSAAGSRSFSVDDERSEHTLPVEKEGD